MTTATSPIPEALCSDGKISAYGSARSTIKGTPLSPEELRKVDAYWRASLYLCLGMLYLKDNPLLREPLKLEHTKPRLLGHWGSDPGQSFTYTHFNRLINKYDLNAIFVSGPGHGAPAVLSQAYLEGTYSEVYPDKSGDLSGMQRFFKQFSFPGGIGSHATPETPGSIHEGGELGYSVSHAFGTVFDHPDLITLVMVGDGESETGPLATSWHSNKFLNPITDGAVLPVLHLNGYKINNPTVLARISHEELEALERGRSIPFSEISLARSASHAPFNRRRLAEGMRSVLARETFKLVLCSPMQWARETRELAGLGDKAVIHLVEWNHDHTRV
jgi:xylulose-5-phosphate/fructose-6-phosphate phosphoketolase